MPADPSPSSGHALLQVVEKVFQEYDLVLRLGRRGLQTAPTSGRVCLRSEGPLTELANTRVRDPYSGFPGHERVAISRIAYRQPPRSRRNSRSGQAAETRHPRPNRHLSATPPAGRRGLVTRQSPAGRILRPDQKVLSAGAKLQARCARFRDKDPSSVSEGAI